MRRRTIFRSLIGCLGLAASAMAQAPAHPEQIEFNFKYQPGRTYAQKIVSRNVGSVSLPAPWPEQKTSQMVEETIVSRCTSVNPDGSGEFEMTIDGLAMKLTIGALTVNYDSKTYDPNAKTENWISALVAKIFNAMNGTKFNTTLSPTGQAIKIQGLSAIFKKMASSMGDDKEEAAIKGMFDQMSSIMDDNTMGQEIQSLYRMVPSKPGPYRVGDKWDHAWDMKIPGVGKNMTGRGEYELMAIKTFHGRPCAQIRTKETFDFSTPQPNEKTVSEPPQKESALAAILKKLDMKLTAKGGDGFAYVDYRTGEIVQMRGTQNIKIEMTMKPDPDAKSDKEQQGQQITQSFRTSIAADLIEPGADSAASGPSPAATATKPAASLEIR